MPSVGVVELLAILAIAAIWLAIPFALIVLIRRRASATARPAAADPALDALRSRLATGEIDEGEYRRLQSVLHGG